MRIAIALLTVFFFHPGLGTCQTNREQDFLNQNLELFRQCKFDEILELCDAVDDGNAMATMAAGLKAFAHAELGNNEQAINAADSALAMEPANDWQESILHCCRSYALIRQGLSADAMTEANKAIELANEQPLPFYLKSFVHYHNGQHLQTIISAEECLARDSHFAMAMMMKGLGESSLWKRKSAIASMERALELEPNYVGGAWIFAMELAIEGEPERALKILNAAKGTNADYYGIHTAESLILQVTQTEGAQASVEKAYELNNKHFEPISAYGNFLSLQGQTEDALKIAERGVELYPNFYHAYLLRAQVLIDLKQYEAAEADFKNAAKMNPTHYRPPFMLALMYRELAMEDKAVEAYRTTQKLNPNYWFAAFHLGQLLAEQNRHEEAIQEFRESLEIMQDYGLIFAERAKCYEAIGKKEKAKADYRTAKSLGWEDE